MSTEEDKCSRCKEKKIGYILVGTQEGKESVCSECLYGNKYREEVKVL